jgi:Tol biopolymer transport system component
MLPMAATAAGNTAAHSRARNGPLTLFTGGQGMRGPGSSDVASIMTLRAVHNAGRALAIGGRPKTIWHCPGNEWCGEAISFVWAPDGRRVAFTLDSIGGNSPEVGFHIANVVSGHDTMLQPDRVGCFAAAELAWSPDGTRLAYACSNKINLLRLRGSGYTTVPTGTKASWPSWSPSATRIAYSTQLEPARESEIYTVALDGSHPRLVARGGAAPAWSPDGRTIAYQTTCGTRLVTPSGRDVTPAAMAGRCGAVGLSGPPVWSPDGTKIAIEANDGHGIRVMNKNGRALHLVSHWAKRTMYGWLPGRPSWRAAQ